MLSQKQKEDLMKALQSGGRLIIKPTKVQSGGFLGTLLASIGIPLALKALTGSGLQVPPKTRAKVLQVPRRTTYQPPPFIGSWNKTGYGKKKNPSKVGEGLLLGDNSPFKNIPVLGAIL